MGESLQSVRRDFEAWVAGPTRAAAQVARLATVLEKGQWSAFILGGAVRDACLLGCTAIPRDLDVVADVEPDRLAEVVDACGIEIEGRTNFGGLRGSADGIQFDVWSLSQTWAYAQGHLAYGGFKWLPRTTPLSIEAIAVEIKPGGRIYDGGFCAALAERVVDLNLGVNPSDEHTAQRLLAFSDRFRLEMTESAQSFLARRSRGVRDL